MVMRSFGSGTLYGQRTDAAGTPVMIGTLQDAQVEISGTNKELYGTGQFAEAVARGQAKITGKAKWGRISPMVYADLYFGVTPTAGQSATAVKEAAAAPAAAPYTLPVANAATFQTDLGVTYANTALPLKKVAANPMQGQYSVAGGTYTFAAADAGAALLISYGYGIAGSGYRLDINNIDQGINPTFRADLVTSFTDPQKGVMKTTLTLYACVSDKLSIPTKMSDWLISEMDFQAFADPSERVMSWSFPELS